MVSNHFWTISTILLWLSPQSFSAPSLKCSEICYQNHQHQTSDSRFAKPGNWSEHNQFVADNGRGKVHEEYGQYEDDSKRVRYLNQNYSSSSVYQGSSNSETAQNQFPRDFMDKVTSLHDNSMEETRRSMMSTLQAQNINDHSSNDGNWSKVDSYKTDDGHGQVTVEEGQVVSGPETRRYYKKNYTSSYSSSGSSPRHQESNYNQFAKDSLDQVTLAQERALEEMRRSMTLTRQAQNSNNYHDNDGHGQVVSGPETRRYYKKNYTSSYLSSDSRPVHQESSYNQFAKVTSAHEKAMEEMRRSMMSTVQSQSSFSHDTSNDHQGQVTVEEGQMASVPENRRYYQTDHTSSYSSVIPRRIGIPRQSFDRNRNIEDELLEIPEGNHRRVTPPQQVEPRYQSAQNYNDQRFVSNRRQTSSNQEHYQEESIAQLPARSSMTEESGRSHYQENSRVYHQGQNLNYDPAFRTQTDTFVSGVVDLGGVQKGADCTTGRKYKRDTSIETADLRRVDEFSQQQVPLTSNNGQFERGRLLSAQNGNYRNLGIEPNEYSQQQVPLTNNNEQFEHSRLLIDHPPENRRTPNAQNGNYRNLGIEPSGTGPESSFPRRNQWNGNNQENESEWTRNSQTTESPNYATRGTNRNGPCYRYNVNNVETTKGGESRRVVTPIQVPCDQENAFYREDSNHVPMQTYENSNQREMTSAERRRPAEWPPKVPNSRQFNVQPLNVGSNIQDREFSQVQTNQDSGRGFYQDQSRERMSRYPNNNNYPNNNQEEEQFVLELEHGRGNIQKTFGQDTTTVPSVSFWNKVGNKISNTYDKAKEKAKEIFGK